ncbi:SPV116 RNA polymerase subunit RPO35 [Swinepox virus]|uniref:DNA-directed RNA polymerase 35 kDa subunit n=2 Tax=Swinepox virus TaxID=10276 RepID=Q8V3I0_SWPV1|nr:SPV116 RNA polymerase subunit RPO35 [Swinepox virus]AAL69855.1 SPV116 RNA polymerase subunit RPO35 [Swinepox virus]QQG31606.1 RNA polymerase subunit RPO35 [Swinepox virus]UED36596.1 SPV116 RNA polymerase subunit RPO35 [Swinepox virus]UED36745.1 SPV116 RNA polymerase subunit RPO35 [Swinepox virus]UUA44306.1 SPV116 [Swinepox virus]
MYREEKTIAIELNPGLATFIKHGFNHRVKWPLLNLGIILNNNTTAVNEEWLTAVEHIPTRKIFYSFTSSILRQEVSFCAYLNVSQDKDKGYVTLGDFDYYIIESDYTFNKIDKPKELNETLVHIFQDYRVKNLQVIELIAFSSGTLIGEEIINQLSFLNIEIFNREYNNIKPILDQKFISCVPFTIIAPLGKLTLFVEHYPWINLKSHLKDIFDFLEGVLISDIHSHKLETSIQDNVTISSYNSATGILFVNDLLTMSIVNFFGCNARLNSYHRFDISVIDIEDFISALSKAFKNIIDLVNY